MFHDNPKVGYKAKAGTSSPDYKNVITWERLSLAL